MSTRPRRSSLKQKGKSVDMLGLSRQEERMLQRAMYDSLRHQSQRGIIKQQIVKSRDDSITTRSKSLTNLSISVPDVTKPVHDSNLSASSCSLSTNAKPRIIEEQKLKRGTRYSPMRKLPLSEMLKTLEDRKNQFNNDRNYTNIAHRTSHLATMKRSALDIIKKEHLTAKQPKLSNDVIIRRPGRPKIIKSEPIESVQSTKELTVFTKVSGRSQLVSKTKRVPRTASLVARSSWMSQNSTISSPPRSPLKRSLFAVDSEPQKVKIKPTKSKPEKLLLKPKRMIYNQKTISQSQRMSKAILANATQRFKKAKIKEKNDEKCQRLTSKIKSAKVTHDSKSKAVIPPELWLDPRGQPVDTEDFINFLIYKDTPYLDKSLKWFGLPPHKRKQRLYKIVPIESTKFNETIVYNEKKEGGGREIVVQCQPPKLNDDSSELVSLDSDQVVVYTSLLDESKTKCPASVNSSCVTQAAVDEEMSSPISWFSFALN